MAEISAIPQQPQLGRLAQFLRYLETEKPEFLPSQLDVMGLVRQLTLPQAATVENLSYGNLPFTMPPSGTGAMIPQAKTGRKPEVADLVGMLGGVPGMGAVADVGTKLSNEAADAIVRAITRNPAATAPAVLEAAGGMVPLSRMFKPEQVKAILPETKIVDEVGNPQLMYHGTTKEFKDFKKNTTPDDHVPGISVTDEPWMASSYAKEVEGSNVRPVYVDAKNPINYEDLEAWALYKAKEKRMKIEDEEDFAAFDIPKDKLLKWLKEDGYDAIDYRSDPMLGYGLRVFEPEQIKSAISDPAFAGLLEPQAATRGFNVVQPGDKVSGLTVRKDVPNMSSIPASLDDYEILSGIREVPRSAFDEEYLGSLSYDKLDKRTKDLVEQIKQSKEINPMIVGIDSKGAYIIEGGHRFDALMSQDTKSIPAVVVIDKSDPPADIGSLLD